MLQKGLTHQMMRLFQVRISSPILTLHCLICMKILSPWAASSKLSHWRTTCEAGGAAHRAWTNYVFEKILLNIVLPLCVILLYILWVFYLFSWLCPFFLGCVIAGFGWEVVVFRCALLLPLLVRTWVSNWCASVSGKNCLSSDLNLEWAEFVEVLFFLFFGWRV